MRLVRIFPQNWEIVISYLAILFIALFLGDGLQPLVFIVGTITALAIFSLKTKQTIGNIPRSILKTWIFLICYIVLRTLFSDSVGLSISTTIRLFLGFVVFYLFANYLNHQKQIHFFLTNLTILSASISLI